MLEWWNSLEPAGMHTFVGIGIVASAILFIQFILVLFGGVIDVPEFDMEAGEGAGGATGMFSIRGIGAFFTGFGWTGATVLDATKSVPWAIVGATLAGVAVLASFLWLMTWLHGLRCEGTVDYANAIGQIGSVYVPIPPKRQGLGQIEVLVQDRMTTVRALTDARERIENRTAVKVVELIDERTLLVETLSSPEPDKDEAPAAEADVETNEEALEEGDSEQ